MRGNIIMLKLFFAVTAFLTILAPAYSGIIMTCSEESLISRILIEGDRLRIDIAEDGDGREGNLIFISETAVSRLIIIDNQESSYYEITSGDMERIKGQVAEALKVIKELMEGMEDHGDEAIPLVRSLVPPEYAGLVDMIDVEQKVLRPESGIRAGEWVVDRYEVYQDGKKITEALFAGVEQFGLGARDFEVLREFDEFLEIPAPGMVPGFLISEVDDENLIPLRIAEFGEDDAKTLTLEIREFREDEINASEFDVPGGFERQELSF